VVAQQSRKTRRRKSSPALSIMSTSDCCKHTTAKRLGGPVFRGAFPQVGWRTGFAVRAGIRVEVLRLLLAIGAPRRWFVSSRMDNSGCRKLTVASVCLWPIPGFPDRQLCRRPRQMSSNKGPIKRTLLHVLFAPSSILHDLHLLHHRLRTDPDFRQP
jgi:hypothetical protein